MVIQVDLAHDAGIVDEHVKLGEFSGDLFKQNGYRPGIADIALKRMHPRQFRLRGVQPGWVSTRNDDDIT
jgi:hypothetical protein